MELTALEIATYCTLFTCALTTVGAAGVFLIKGKPKSILTKLCLGFAAGIMLSAAFFSLLLPAFEIAKQQEAYPQIPILIGFIAGMLFLILVDKSLPHLHFGSANTEGPKLHLNKSTLIFIAITIHNIPEGIALGVSAMAAVTGDGALFAAALSLALGIGLQNIPEGLAVSLPYYVDGMSKTKAFILGLLSGLVEPLAALILVLLFALDTSVLPYLLAFAAGSMMYVVVEELIPEASGHSDAGTLSVLCGFVLMMLLDTLF